MDHVDHDMLGRTQPCVISGPTEGLHLMRGLTSELVVFMSQLFDQKVLLRSDRLWLLREQTLILVSRSCTISARERRVTYCKRVRSHHSTIREHY